MVSVKDSMTFHRFFESLEEELLHRRARLRLIRIQNVHQDSNFSERTESNIERYSRDSDGHSVHEKTGTDVERLGEGSH